MQKGDLSNAPVPAWIVTLDALVDGALPGRRRFESWEHAADRIKFSQQAVSALWLLSFKVAARWELAAFEVSYDFVERAVARLDEQMAHPISHKNEYHDRFGLVSSLAYRPEVQYVIDLPQYALHYGSRGMTLKGAFGLG